MPIDYKKYPPNWKYEIVPRILKRANNCCEVCGVKNNMMVFRGLLSLEEVYQYEKGDCFSYPNGNYKGKFICEVQPIKGDPLQKAIKIVLTIAHLDHDETNWDVKDDRLKAMCQKCHLQYDSKEKSRRREARKGQIKLF